MLSLNAGKRAPPRFAIHNWRARLCFAKVADEDDTHTVKCIAFPVRWRAVGGSGGLQIRCTASGVSFHPASGIKGPAMEKGIFGSTISLGGLLNDSFFTDGETDQFLREFEQGVPKDLLEVHACGEADSGATSFDSTISGGACEWSVVCTDFGWRLSSCQ